MHDPDAPRESEPRRGALAFAAAALAGAAPMLAACSGGGGSTAQAQAPVPEPDPEPAPTPKYDPIHGPSDPNLPGHEVDIERNSFANIDEVFAIGVTAERYEFSGAGNGLKNADNDIVGHVSVEGGDIYIGQDPDRFPDSQQRWKVENGTQIRETEHRRNSSGRVTCGARTTIATGARIERKGRDDYVTFGWWYRVNGQQFMDSAPDHGKPYAAAMRAFAGGPEFDRVPDTFPTGLAEYPGPAIGLHTTEKDGNRTTKEFSGIASFGISYRGDMDSSYVVGNLSIDGERIFSVERASMSHRSGWFFAIPSMTHPDLRYARGGYRPEVVGEISSVLEDGFPRAMLGHFDVGAVDVDPGIKGAVITHQATWVGAFHAPLVATPARR